MVRSLIVPVLLASVLVCGCTTPRPDPALLDLPPEAFAGPPPGTEKEPPEESRVVKDRVSPLVAVGTGAAGFLWGAAYVALLMLASAAHGCAGCPGCPR
jgi:hypothetical protein